MTATQEMLKQFMEDFGVRKFEDIDGTDHYVKVTMKYDEVDMEDTITFMGGDRVRRVVCRCGAELLNEVYQSYNEFKRSFAK